MEDSAEGNRAEAVRSEGGAARTAGGRLPLVGPLVCVFAAADLIIPAVVINGGDAWPIVAILTGTVPAQLGLMSIWAVLGAPQAMVRIPLTFLVTALLYAILIHGACLAETPPLRYYIEAVRTILIVPLVFLAAQLPVWILRVIAGSRIVRAGAEEGTAAHGARQFGIQHMLLATALVAVTLGLASAGVPRDGQSPGGVDASAWLGLLIACGVSSGASALATLPCLWAGLIARNKAVGGWVLVLYVFTATFVLLLIGSLLGGDFPPGEVVVAFFLFNGSWAGVMFGTLSLARACGYVYVQPRRTEEAAAPLICDREGSPFASIGPEEPIEQ